MKIPIEGTTFEGAWELLAKWCPAQAYQTNRRHEIEWITLTALTPAGGAEYTFKDRRCIHCGLRDAFIEEGDE